MIKPKTTILFATVLPVGAFLATEASAPGAQPPVPKPPLYVVEYDVGPANLPGRPFAELESRGVLLFGGPVFADLDTFTVSGALLIFDVGSLGEARRLAEADPAIASGLLVIVEVKPFMAVISPV